jgi:DNA-binding beta-propeller fold protein YncE
MLGGQGDFRYELHEEWEQLPEGWEHGDVAGVATDARDNVYIFNRSEHPLIIYDREGRFLGSWGEGVFTRPHGVTIADDILYLADDGDHTVRKFTLDGKLLLTIGTPHQPSETGYDPKISTSLLTIAHGGAPFNRPTRLSVAPSGELYVSDGYGNARIHRFAADGTLLQSWGGPGSSPGEFNLPHSVWVHSDGRVFVCDRENERVQIFDPQGVYLEEWTNMNRPGDLFIDAAGHVYIGEMNWWQDHVSLSGKTWTEDRLARMTVRDLNGEVISTFGGDPAYGDPCAPGNFTSPHGICVDSHGDVYVGEVSKTSYEGTMYRPGCHSLQKFVRVR